jgi:hypothetical protein
MSIVLVGSTSGSITLQEPAIAGSTVLDLPALSGTVLTTTSPKVGNVIQVVGATQATATSTTSTSYVDTGLTATITPTSSSSKILVIHSAQYRKNTGDVSNAVNVMLVRNSTNIQKAAGFGGFTFSNIFATWNVMSSFVDSPATTSATTYKVQFASTISGQTANYLTDGAEGYITLMEIAG